MGPPLGLLSLCLPPSPDRRRRPSLSFLSSLYNPLHRWVSPSPSPCCAQASAVRLVVMSSSRLPESPALATSPRVADDKPEHEHRAINLYMSCPSSKLAYSADASRCPDASQWRVEEASSRRGSLQCHIAAYLNGAHGC
jgi:hypothetical protein